MKTFDLFVVKIDKRINDTITTESRSELETLKSVMDTAYSEDESLDDLLGDLGISLN